MNYTINGKNYIADDGYVFQHKETDGIYKKLRLAKNDSIENYNIIIEPVQEEQEIDNGTAI